MPATKWVTRPSVCAQTSGAVVRLRVPGVGVLVGAPRAEGLGHDAAGGGVVRAGIIGGDRGRADDDLRAVGPEHAPLLLADLVWHGEDAAVAAVGGDDGQADTGV